MEIKETIGHKIISALNNGMIDFPELWNNTDAMERTCIIDMLNKIEDDSNQPESENCKLPIPFVRASALIKRFSEWNNKYPKGRIYSRRSSKAE